jgi:ligand-binding sensor domain-containing protein/signal transduction histidine kinase/CheY-like chemotaxis protein/AraC-like DNA-binding protein
MQFKVAHTFLIIFTIALAHAQTPDIKFKKYSIENNLSNSTIEAIVQDSKGFLWVGTRHGLNRFDGKSFEKFFVSNTSSGLTHNFITSLLVSVEGKLWIGTQKGLSFFTPENHKITRVAELSAKFKILNDIYVTNLLSYSKDEIWISTQKHGLILLNLQNETLEHFSMHPEKSNGIISNNITCAHYYDGKIWIGTPVGIQNFDPSKKEWQIIDAFGRQNITCMTHMNDTLVIGTADEGLYLFSPEKNEIKVKVHIPGNQYSIGSNMIKSLFVTKNNDLWVGCINGGLNRYKAGDDLFYNYSNQPMDPTSLSQRTVSALFEDHQGNLWIGTHRGGLNIYSPGITAFQLERKTILANSLSYNDVKSFYEDKNGNIWIGTDGGGLNIWNPKTKIYQHFYHNPSNNQSLSSNEVMDITGDSDGYIWIGTWGGGISRYDTSTQKFIRFKKNNDDIHSISSDYIQTIYEDSKKNLWIGTYGGGLNRYDKSSEKFFRITEGKGNTFFEGNNCLVIEEDHLGNLWFGTDDGGLNCLESKSGSFLHFFNNSPDNPDIRVIHVSHGGKIWVGHFGLYLFDSKKNDFKKVDTKSELDQVFIKAIEEDQMGNLWVTTSNGLFKVNKNNFKTKKFNKEDGLQGNEFEAHASMTSKGGQIFFGGLNGFNYFFPQDIRDNSYLPPVFINYLSYYNKKLKKIEKIYCQDGQDLVLDHDQNNFYINLSAINFITPENNTFAYKLENWDADWLINTKNEINYTNVTPGDYIFRTKASNNDGLWNNEEKKIKITIKAPFYATTWFIGIIVLLVIFTLSYLYKLRSDLEMEKYAERKKEELHNLELQFFTDISHDLKTPLSLILMALERIKKINELSNSDSYFSTISRNALKLLNLINELMDFRKVEAGALILNVKPGNPKILIEELVSEYTMLAASKHINFEIHIQEKPIEHIFFDRQVLEKIISNVLGNAFKNTPDTKSISVALAYNTTHVFEPYKNFTKVDYHKQFEKYFTIQISDTGQGIAKENLIQIFDRYSKFNDNQNGSGIGLAFVKSLTLLHQGNISIFSEKNKGTAVLIAIPYLKEYYTGIESRQKILNKDYTKLESLRSDEDMILSLEPVSSHKNDTTSGNLNSNASILIVDDNAELREYIRETLVGFQIFEANDGQEGLSMAVKKSPDIIITDVIMPNMDGYEFCKAIKENVLTNHITIIILSAKSSESSRMEGLNRGADYYFTKPFSQDLLYVTVNNIIDSKIKFSNYYKNTILKYVDSSEDSQLPEIDFLQSFIALVEEDMSDSDLNIDNLCQKMGMSRTKLYHKIKLSTGMPISDFIRTLRLKKAASLLLKDDVTIAEAMYHVGIHTHSYFTKAFKTEFGMTPSQYVKLNKK